MVRIIIDEHCDCCVVNLLLFIAIIYGMLSLNNSEK